MSKLEITRRRLTVGGAVLAGAVVGGVNKKASAASLTPFKIGISTPAFSILPVYFAKDGDFAKAYGLDMSIVDAEGGTRGIQVLLSGDIQAMHVGLAPVIQANLHGADLRLVASCVNTMPFVLYGAKKQTPILPKGTRIGISTFGSETDIAVSVALNKLGLNRADYAITQIGGTSQRLMAMIAGRIDVAPLLEPAITKAKERGFVPVMDLAAAHTPWIFDAVVVNKSYSDSRPPALMSFLKAYVEGAIRGLGDPVWAKSVIAQRFKMKDEKVVDATYNVYRQLVARDLSPSLPGAENVIKQLKAIKLPVGSDDPNAYLNLTLMKQLESDGFLSAMKKKYNVT